MTVVETVARARIGGGAAVEQLVCHPRLPLIAGLSSDRPAVHVWDCGAGQLRELGTVGADSAVYGDASGWDRSKRTPFAAWHPHEPLLLVAADGGVVRWTAAGTSAVEGLPPADGGVVRWTAAGTSAVEGLPPGAAYKNLAFSPDGNTLWAAPAAADRDDTWESSDAIDLVSGAVRPGPCWDTGITPHPAGGLVVTFCSDQGATLGIFAKVDQDGSPAALRVLGRALILQCDGYEQPIFSADGRHLAIRGNAYDNSVEVFEFPSLERVLATTLGEPSPGYPYPDAWLEGMRAWSRYNIAFGRRPGVLWIGTPHGTLVETGLDDQRADEHDVLAGAPVTALAATATGELVVAGGGGELLLVAVPAGPDADPAAAAAAVTAPAAAAAAVAVFVAATTVLPEDADLDEHLVVTDGTRTWAPADLATVTTAADTDPGWLQIQAAMNGLAPRSE